MPNKPPAPGQSAGTVATDPVIAEDLTKRFGEFTAVDRVSFQIHHGEVFGWLGPNGAGKTTTIRMLLGLIRPSSGKLSVLGFDPVTQAKTMQAHVGYMSQLFTLYNDLTARENIHFYGRVYGLNRKVLAERQKEIIQMAGLEGHEDTLTSNLSGGWKQRLALGCAIVHNPKVIFLDEPTAGVDAISRREFWGLIYAMANKGTTILVTTHYMDEAELCQRVGFINQGCLVAIGTPDDLKQTSMRGQVLEIDTPEADRGMRILKDAQSKSSLPFDEVALYGAQIHVVVPSADEFLLPVRKMLESEGITVNTIEWIMPTLEDVFISTVSVPAVPVVTGNKPKS